MGSARSEKPVGRPGNRGPGDPAGSEKDQSSRVGSARSDKPVGKPGNRGPGDPTGSEKDRSSGVGSARSEKSVQQILSETRERTEIQP